jgi:MerR family transcriptional regulator, light-induced transcriptional regulator
MNRMIQSDKSGLFSIQQVADMTGLSKQVIRKWEERYGIIQPKRLENGYRIYSQEDVKMLLKIKLLSEQGHSLKKAILFAKESNEDPEVPMPKGDTSNYEQWNEYVFRLLDKGSQCDEIEINFILKQAYHQVGLESFLTYIVVPFLKEVGRKWENGDWSEYQESVSSLVVRDFLVQIRRNYHYREPSPFVLGACLPYEHHEVPLHLILLRFMMKGWKTQLIGASPAPGSIETLVSKLKPDMVLLSASTSLPFENDPGMLQRLDQFAENQPNTIFYLGGQGAISYISDHQPRAIRVTNSIEEILN